MYKLECHLMGHQDTILCLAMSRSGQLLASRGMDGLRIWNIEKKKPLSKLAQLQNPGDLVTLITWVTHKGDLQEGLCCSTGLGYLTIWRQHPNEYYDFKEVTSKKISVGTKVTAVNADICDRTRDQQVQVWSLNSKYQLYNIFSIELPTIVPWALFFQEGRGVIIFRMYNSKVGAASVDPSHKFLVIDNATIGFSLHCMGDATCVNTYDTKPQKTYPQQVTFAERGRVIVAIATLKIWLSANSNSKKASSSNDHNNTITIWKKSIKPGPGNRTWVMIQTALQMAMQCLAIAIVEVILYCTMGTHMYQEGKVNLQYIWEFQLDENIICWVLTQELAAKLSMDDKNKILNAVIKE
ncbi:hypothetical protein J3A83DRAFT_4187563 [Scleroderma citrinum]